MTLADDTRGFEHRFVDTNGIRLHAMVGGSGPLVVLLHGFPEHWATWRHVMRPIVDAGFTVAAVDLRGFNESEKPARVADYRLEHVALGHRRARPRARLREGPRGRARLGRRSRLDVAHDHDEVIDKP